jgi:hypothetical protein
MLKPSHHTLEPTPSHSLCYQRGAQYVFTFLLTQGQQGGRAAAQQLTKGITEYLSNEDVHIFGRLSFWVTVYFNKELG